MYGFLICKCVHDWALSFDLEWEMVPFLVGIAQKAVVYMAE